MSAKSHPQQIPKRRVESDDAAPRHGWHAVTFHIPPLPRITAITAAGGGTGLMIAIGTGYIPSHVAWPLVTLSVSAMLYDLGRRALGRHR
ncbi:hypothetical protein [Streptomyces caniscabiei]|uniref:hypothetical protein n=1 Tax=Streptomyces caniscabiei TaxID=2746961 RepID=UPI000765C72B|nr:hypothetical protein [Streptomyces caniscabiei]